MKLLLLSTLLLLTSCGSDRFAIAQPTPTTKAKTYLTKEMTCRADGTHTMNCYSHIDIDEEIIQVILVKRLSKVDCILDKTYTFDNWSIYNSKGCAGKFLIVYTRK